MLASGADVSVVSTLLGHASIAMTADVYGHLVGTIAQQAVDVAAALIVHTVDTSEAWMLDGGFVLSGESASHWGR
jgi:hypothetical protein